MAIDNASKMKAIRKAIKILRESNSKNKMMNVNERNYVIDILKDIEKQLQVEKDEQTGMAWWQDMPHISTVFSTIKVSPKYIVILLFLLLDLLGWDVWLMTCKGRCEQHRALRPADGSGRYSAGQKRCAMCEIFIKWKGSWCPCCGCRLRSKPRNTVDRRRAAMDLSNASNNRPQALLYH